VDYDGENGYLKLMKNEFANRIDAMKDQELLKKRLKNLSIVRENAFANEFGRVKAMYASLNDSIK
jgi:hypothetical protein